MARTTTRPADTTAADRRRQARAAQQAALARAKRRRTLTQLGIVAGVAVVVIAIIATAVVLGNRGKTSAAAPTGTSSTISLEGKQVPLAILDTGVRLGSPDAKVTIDMWVDYSCPHCKEFEADNNQTLTDFVAGGNVAVTYHNIQVHSEYGTVAGAASLCVAQHDPTIWPAFNAAIYTNASDATLGWGTSDFATFAASNGAGSATQSCITDGTYADWVTQNTAAAEKQGIDATPTMLIDGKQTDILSGQDLTNRVNQLIGD